MTDVEDAEALALMKTLGVDGDVESDGEEVEELDPEEIAEKWRREVAITPDNCLDQVVLGASDFEWAMKEFEKLSGVTPCVATKVRGQGIQSARVAFEECAFLELVGPDPNQEETEFGKQLKDLPANELVPIHYGVRFEAAKELKTRNKWKEMGMECDQITMVSKDRGMPWFWDMYVIKGDGCFPFLTDWLTHDSKHQSSKLPIVGTLTDVKVSAPADHLVHKLISSPENMDLSTGSASLSFTIAAKSGASLTFSGSDPIGMSFPEEGGISK